MLVVASGLFASAAFAHPHIFVDTALTLRISAKGELLGIEVTWVFDDYYSLVVLEERALDPDFDGELTAEELATLQGFTQEWIGETEGDLFVTQDAIALPLGAPTEAVTEVSQGRITTRHLRPLTTPVAADGLMIQAYDPTYYTAYLVGSRVTLPEVETCSVSVTEPNFDRAYTLVEETLYAMSSAEAEENFPKIGQSFADTIRISCAHGS